MMNLSVDNVQFPERRSIVKSDVHLDNIIDKAKKIDVQNVNFDGEDYLPKTKIIQKQRTYLWMRLYMKQEIDIEPETKVQIQYLNGKESLDSFFMYFGKKGLERNKDGEIVNFNPEDDKKILCLLIDVDKLDVDNKDIPYMKTLFPLGKYYQPQYVKKMDFTFVLENGTELDFYEIDF
jgi:hypothetical protein